VVWVSENSTHFGFTQIPKEEKVRRVEAVFSSVADRYDLMNDLMSLGMHRLWKRFAVTVCQIRPGHRVLDLAAGTGDLSLRIRDCLFPGRLSSDLPSSDRPSSDLPSGECLLSESPVKNRGTDPSVQLPAQHSSQLVMADINAAMLQHGWDRLFDTGSVEGVLPCRCNAESLPFAHNYFDRILMGFGLRNVTDKMAALRECYRVLRPGGRFLVLEFSHLKIKMLERVYDDWSFIALPLMGKWIAKDEKSYRYLAESIRMHPDQQTLAETMRQAGFDQVTLHDLCGGIVAVHVGVKW
jgi:demethylmenaquinone methyltransferase/2-methoxy-6-polyprenyl-1,4-benzoquinol methylase